MQSFLSGSKWVRSERADLWEIIWLIKPISPTKLQSILCPRWRAERPTSCWNFNFQLTEWAEWDNVLIWTQIYPLCEHIWCRKKKNLWTPSIRYCQGPNLREQAVRAAWQKICAFLVWLAFSFLFFRQSASSSHCPFPSFSVPARWFNQGKQLGTGRAELVSKPGWFTGSPDLLYISSANRASLAASHGNKKAGGKHTGWQSTPRWGAHWMSDITAGKTRKLSRMTKTYGTDMYGRNHRVERTLQHRPKLRNNLSSQYRGKHTI